MKPQVSIVIPAYNESERIVAPLRTILDFVEASDTVFEVIVVDDGSSDDTAEVARRICAERPAAETNVIRYDENRGKGFAVNTGLQAAKADIAVFTDADLSTPITEIDKLVGPIASSEYDVTFGSRALDRSLIGTHQSWLRENGGRVINLMIPKMSGLDFADTQF